MVVTAAIVVESALLLRLEQLPVEVLLLLPILLPPTLIVYTDEGTMVKEVVTERDDAINKSKTVAIVVDDDFVLVVLVLVRMIGVSVE